MAQVFKHWTINNLCSALSKTLSYKNIFLNGQWSLETDYLHSFSSGSKMNNLLRALFRLNAVLVNKNCQTQKMKYSNKVTLRVLKEKSETLYLWEILRQTFRQESAYFLHLNPSVDLQLVLKDLQADVVILK